MSFASHHSRGHPRSAPEETTPAHDLRDRLEVGPRLPKPPPFPAENDVSGCPDRQATWGSPITKRFPRPLGIKTGATGLWFWLRCSGFLLFRPCNGLIRPNAGCAVVSRFLVEQVIPSIACTRRVGSNLRPRRENHTPTFVITFKTPGLPSSRGMLRVTRCTQPYMRRKYSWSGFGQHHDERPWPPSGVLTVLQV